MLVQVALFSPKQVVNYFSCNYVPVKSLFFKGKSQIHTYIPWRLKTKVWYHFKVAGFFGLMGQHLPPKCLSLHLNPKLLLFASWVLSELIDTVILFHKGLWGSRLD